jgi:hypothetical protein
MPEAGTRRPDQPNRCWTPAERKPTGRHPVDRLGAGHAIDHRPTASAPTSTSNDTVQRDAALYNPHIPQRSLGHVSPVNALMQWHQKQPDLCLCVPGNLPGPDS